MAEPFVLSGACQLSVKDDLVTALNARFLGEDGAAAKVVAETAVEGELVALEVIATTRKL